MECLHALCVTRSVKIKCINITSSWKCQLFLPQGWHCRISPSLRTKGAPSRFCCTGAPGLQDPASQSRSHLISLQAHCKRQHLTGTSQNSYFACWCCQHKSFSATALLALLIFIPFECKQARNAVFPFSYLYFFQSSSESTYWHLDHICIQMMACCWKKSLQRGWLTSFQTFAVPDQGSQTRTQLTAWLISECEGTGFCILHCSLWTLMLLPA